MAGVAGHRFTVLAEKPEWVTKGGGYEHNNISGRRLGWEDRQQDGVGPPPINDVD